MNNHNLNKKLQQAWEQNNSHWTEDNSVIGLHSSSKKYNAKYSDWMYAKILHLKKKNIDLSLNMLKQIFCGHYIF
jgi:hypothetical protein